jgi:hypothetical protein
VVKLAEIGNASTRDVKRTSNRYASHCVGVVNSADHLKDEGYACTSGSNP